jgi:hypothetical protein
MPPQLDILTEHSGGGCACNVPRPLPILEGVLDGAFPMAASDCIVEVGVKAANRSVRKPGVGPEKGGGAVTDQDGDRSLEHLLDYAFGPGVCALQLPSISCSGI